MYCQDSAVNYIRDADILVSDDLENWTKSCKLLEMVMKYK